MALTVLGKALESSPSCGSILSLSMRPSGALRLSRAGDAVGDGIEIINAESQGHAPLAAELVDEDLVAGMALDVFEEKRGAAGFGDAVGDLGDFQLGRDFFADALQFAVIFEGFDPVAQIVVGHGVLLGRCATPS